MRPFPTALFVLTISVLVLPAALAEDDGGESDTSSQTRRVPRPQHDVRVRISKARAGTGGVRFRVTVRNRGRSAERDVAVAVVSDMDPLNPIWSATTDLRRNGHRSWRLVLEVPDGTTRLTATAACASDADGRPSDNEDSTPVEAGGGVGGTQAMTPAEAGAVLFTAQCASCHGTTGTGGTVDENISDESARDLLEAVREGEDGMPTFPGITWQDAQNIAAYLRDPVAPPTPGTGGTGGGTTTTPTYGGRIASILSANCTACHAGAAATANIRLDTYATASTNASKALAAMSAGRMPPAGPLSSATIASFKAWIDGGKPR